jgi:hypothetical protein
MRILLANEPNAYRDVLASAVQILCPGHEALSVAPDELDDALAQVAPHMVVCSRLTPAVETCSGGWIMLYPGGETRVVICIGGQQFAVGDLEIGLLLAVIDKVERFTETG